MPSETQIYTIRLRERGQLTIPRNVRENLKTAAGDMLTLVQIGELMMLTPRRPRVPELAEQFTVEMENEGVSLADLLSGLAEEREAIYYERHQDA